MPLTDTEWGLVTTWVRDYFLDTPDPYTPLRQFGFSQDFIADLPLTAKSGQNAIAVVQASRKDIASQRRLLDALLRLDDLSATQAGAEAQEFRARLHEDEDVHFSAQDHFLTSVLKNGTEVFIDRGDLRSSLREFVHDPEKTVLIVDGDPDSGRSYTYNLIRHLGQHCGFRPVRITLSRTSRAEKVIQRLAEFVTDPRTGIPPLNPTQLNDPLPSIDDAIHRVVSRATAADERFWLVLDECDKLDVNSDVWDCIGKLALAIYEYTPVRLETAPRLVLLGYSATMRQLPYDIRKNECRDTARVAGPDDLRAFFGQFFAESSPADASRIAGLVEEAVSAVLCASESPGDPEDESYMRKVCTATEKAVRVHRSLAPGEDFTTKLRQELQTASLTGCEPVRDLRRLYREAACLLTQFDPTHLRLPDGARATEGPAPAAGAAALELVHDCTSLGMRRTTTWVLKPGVREAALRGLAGPQAARRALEANLGQIPEGPGPERTALALLSGTPPDVEGQSVDELADTLQAVLWLARVPGMTGLPDVEHIQRRLERARLVQPLERLVRDSFQGRADELDQLRTYAGLPADSPSARLRQTRHGFMRAVTRTPEPPLVIHGLGGVGKSTLLAKFLLDSLRDFRSGFPFAYVDFERPTLSIHEPATLIAEIARQLGIQFPDFRGEFDAVADECELTAGTQRVEQSKVDELYELSTTRPTLGRASSSGFHVLASARETDLVRRVGRILVRAVATPAGEAGPPLVIAVDSFEEAQYRGSPVIGRMWAIWAALQEVCPRLRFIVSGRAPVGHPAQVMAPRTIALGDLDMKAAVGLLTSCGVEDAQVAQALAERVGGHPLSLKLAARAAVLAGGEARSLRELVESLPARRRYFYRKVDQMLVQGTLYERILQHIANRDVRELAQAGMALRTITPDLIAEVLAEPCGLAPLSPDDARRLFGLLARLDLVEPAGPQAVRHRSDLRAIMLRLAEQDRTDVLRRVGQRAVAYYAAREGPENRAEEIYHRLRLNENPRAVEERWTPGVERYLEESAQDMTGRSAAFLTGHLGGHTPDQVMAEADQEDWERIAAREVEDLLAQGFTEAAAARLAERRPWTPGSPLHPLLVETLARQGRRTEARTVAEEAVDRAQDTGRPELQLELLLLSARLAEEDGDVEAAERDLVEAEDIATHLGRDFEAMGAMLARARLTGASAAEESEVEDRLARRLRQLPDEALTQQPALVRAVTAEVGRQDPGALDHTLKVVGLPTDDEGVLDTLAESIRRTLSDQPQLRGALLRIVDTAVGSAEPPQAPQPPQPSRIPQPERPPDPGQSGGSGQSGASYVDMADILREARELGTLDELAQRLLVVRDGSGELISGVAAAMGAGTAVHVPTLTPHQQPPEEPHQEAAHEPSREASQEPPGQPRPPATAGGAMHDTYLPAQEVVRLRDAALEAGLTDPSIRRLLLDGIMPKYRGTLPLVAAPGPQVHSDLNEMNHVERLIDGSVPLEIWLRNAVAQTAEAGPLAVFQHALDRVARDAAGEPDVPAPALTGETKEEIIHRDDTVPYEFLRGGEVAGTAVARLKVLPYQSGAPLQPNGFPHAGTGWLIAPDLLVTNHHVVNARTRTTTERPTVDPADLRLQARNSRARFDYGADETETEEASAGELVAWDEELDYAILRLAPGVPPRHVLRVATEPLRVTRDEPVAVNIIQHPGGQPKRVALRNNLVYEADERDVRYFTDTRGGSSGSPVLTDDWTVVALHRGTRRVEDVNFQGRRTAFVNVGTQMSSVLNHVREHSPELYAEITAAQSALSRDGQPADRPEGPRERQQERQPEVA